MKTAATNKTKMPPGVTESSGNVFADLRFPNPEQELLKARLGFHIYQILEARELKQREIAAILKIAPPDASHVMNGHYSRFTMDKLLEFLRRLNQKVTIQIRPHRPGEPYQEIAASL